MGYQRIPKNLIDKYGEDILRGGLAAADHKRNEYVFNHPSAKREFEGRRINPGVTPDDPDQQWQEQTTPNQPLPWPSSVKIWPVVVLTSITTRHGGGARVWALAKAIDHQGSGKVSRPDLWAFIDHLGIGGRKRRRWLRDALDLGLLREHDDIYYLAGWGPGAVALGCHQVGRPATVSALSLTSAGWRSHVWGAFISTLNGRPMSQETMAEITTIDPRTQRNYQAAIPMSTRRNYAEIDLPGDHVDGLREHGRSSAFVGRDGRVIYRLPDQREVPNFIAQAQPKGRSRKAQKQVNISFSVEREPNFVMRLFHETHRGVEAAIRKLSRADIPPWSQPAEVFELLFAGRTTNLWQPVRMQS